MAFPNNDNWFEDQIEPHESSLRAWLRCRFMVNDMIDDIVQETYIRILKSKNRSSIKSPRAYLFQTARNVAIDHLKDLNKHRAEPFDEGSKIIQIDQWNQTKDYIEYRNEVQLLKDSIEALPDRCREIFVMRRIHGLKSAEISRILGISTHTVSSQLTIGLRKCTDFIERATKASRSEAVR